MKHIYRANGTCAYKPYYENESLFKVKTHEGFKDQEKKNVEMPELPKDYLKNTQGYSFTKNKKESRRLACFALLSFAGFLTALGLLSFI